LLELAIEAATRRMHQLWLIRTGDGCLLCTRFVHTCNGCPARNAKKISCKEYGEAIDEIRSRLSQQIELWKNELPDSRKGAER